MHAVTRERGDHRNVSVWTLNARTGTHIDAPLHFVNDGASIDQITNDTLRGPCFVVNMTGTLDITAATALKGVRRLLIRTGFGESETLTRHPPLLAVETAQTLLDAGLTLQATLGTYERCATPLSMAGTEASPARVILASLGRSAIFIDVLAADSLPDA